MTTKLGIFVGEKGNWSFFDDLYGDFQRRYQTDVFVRKEYNTPLLYGRLNRWAFRAGIEAILRRNDVCFFEWASELLVPASQMRKHCPIIARLHSYELFAWAPLVNWDNVDRLILVSQAMQVRFNELYPAHAHKTAVIYNAKPLDVFTPTPRQFNFNLGMLCSFNPRKRVYETILMLHELRQRGIDATLHLAGGRLHAPDFDEYYVACQAIVDKLGLRDNIIFYGHIDETAAWLQTIDIFISNSYWEGHQVALVEAMAAGCYCLTHFWEGTAEFLPPEYIFVTEGELIERIVSYGAASETERAAHQARLRAIACEKFDLEDARRQFRAEIEALAG